jgi:hypothetical protein
MIFANGRYSFRFAGYAMSRAIPHHLVGIGWMQLGPGASPEEQAIGGEHVAAITRLEGSDAAFESTRYTMTGKLIEKDGFGLASIVFTEHGAAMDKQILEAGFQLVPAGDGRIWLISSSTRIVSSGNAPADELVSGEAVRISD